MKYILFISCILINFFFSLGFFQTSFFKEVNKENRNKNINISPLSAYQVLGLTANGAKKETLEQMLLALGNSNLEELNLINTQILSICKQFTTVEIANAIMTKFRPKQTFMDVADLYESTVEQLYSLSQVNNWCNLKTHGTIPTILDELPGNVVMILLNAIYFKGSWKTEFDTKNTTKQLFYNLNSQEVYADTMKLKEKFNYYEDKDVQIVEMPYTYDSMSAVIFLPNKDTNINEFIDELTDEKLQKFLKRMNEQIVQIELPKFKLEFSSELNNVLQKMGMVTPFKGYADFTGIIDGSIYIDKVIQKAYLSIDEKGTEASSATAVVMIKGMAPPTYPMIINRPFLFMLRNKNFPQNYEMLFMAKIEEL